MSNSICFFNLENQETLIFFWCFWFITYKKQIYRISGFPNLQHNPTLYPSPPTLNQKINPGVLVEKMLASENFKMFIDITSK